MLERVLVGIVTYNPEIERLLDNIAAVKLQTDNIIIVDNGSVYFNSFKKEIPESIKIIKNIENLGIAKALRQIMDYAKKNDFEWVLTLDQDSLIRPGLINKYIKYSCQDELQDVGIFTCLIKDRNFSDKEKERQEKCVEYIPYCITSAAFTNVRKYLQTTGYNINYFIDAVDFDFCLSLREKGYRIARIKFFGLYHEVGHGENRKFLWKKIVIYHSEPFRVYYMARNMILMHDNHKKMFPWYMVIKKEIVLLMKIILYEKRKKEKISYFWKGIKAAKKRKGNLL